MGTAENDRLDGRGGNDTIVGLTVKDSNSNAPGVQPESGPSKGQLTLNTNGSYTYTPNANYHGPDSFTYKVNDGSLDSNVATVSITVNSVNDAPVVSNLQGAGTANEGDTKDYTFDITDVDSSNFSFDSNYPNCGEAKTEIVGTPQISGNTGSFKCRFLDGPATPTVSVRVSDGQTPSNVDSKNVNVSNVDPTITGVTSSVQNALTGRQVSFTGTATDLGSLDTAFSWQWAVGTNGTYGTYAAGPNSYSTSLSICGSYTVRAKATDKDNGVSAPFTSNAVNVYDAAYKAPLVPGTINKVQKGQVVPVKISIGCGTTNLTGLSPHIQLLNGDASPENETGLTAITTSVSSADTGQIMRPVDGGYIYNLRVPDAAVGTKYTVRVNPFGATASHQASGMWIVLEIRK